MKLSSHVSPLNQFHDGINGVNVPISLAPNAMPYVEHDVLGGSVINSFLNHVNALNDGIDAIVVPPRMLHVLIIFISPDTQPV